MRIVKKLGLYPIQANEVMQKIKKYIVQSTTISNKSIIKALNTAQPYFTPSCV